MRGLAKIRAIVEEIRYWSPTVSRPNAQVGNQRIARCIEDGVPAAIGKIGATELQAMRAFLRTQKAGGVEAATKRHRLNLLRSSGVYPDSYEIFEHWSLLWLEKIMPEMTHIGVWFNFNESRIVKRYAKTAHLFHSHGLEPYIFDDPWTVALAGKRVVVISPFSDSIQLQYKRRDKIWALHPKMLPDFELRTVQCPTYPDLVRPAFPTWFEALENLKHQLTESAFDVVIVGAGAYSLPLCVHAKLQGKIGIHLGGNAQLLFGLLGRRWMVKGASIDRRYFNDAWSFPLPQETPTGYRRMEDGCYWR